MTKRYTGGVVSSSLPTVNAAGASGVFNLSQQADAQTNNKWPPFKVEKSLRFRNSSVAYLTRTPSVAGNTKTFTWSGWIKNSLLKYGTAFAAGNNNFNLKLAGADGNTYALEVYDYNGSTFNYRLVSNALYRDPAAWYHLVLAVDTTQSTSSNRVKVYINGSQVTSLSTASYPSQNYNTYCNSVTPHYHNVFGSSYLNTTYANDCYMSEINFVDGLALTPSSFGGTDKDGNWSPIAYTGTYGQNGFYLNFKDASSTSTIGYDYSGNGNNWTASGFNVTTANTSYDSVIDVPSDQAGANTRGNYATLNSVDPFPGTMANGNLTHYIGSNDFASSRSTIGMKGGKWYWEAKCETNLGANFYMGIGICSDSGYNAAGYPGQTNYGYNYDGRATKVANGGSSSSYGATYTNGDIIGVAFDSDNGTLEYYKNGSSQGVAFTGIPTTETFYANHWVYTTQISYNFGQQGFVYTPPAGYKALCTYNLTEPTIKAPNKQFDATLYTGANSAQTITNAGGFQPSLIWFKARNVAYYNTLEDDIRGAGTRLFSNLTDGESNDGILTSFNSNGFSLGVNSGEGINNTAGNYVAWQWKGATSNTSNTDGSVTSNIRANPTAGFSVITATTPSSGNFTFGHGLGTKPSFFISKMRGGGWNWHCWHKSLSSDTNSVIILNTTSSENTTYNMWGASGSNTTTIGGTVGTAFDVSSPFICYAWSEIEGFSKFGKYTGNGSTNGPFVYCGFRPKFVMMKSISATGSWILLDSSRSTYNAADAILYPNLSNAEDSGRPMDFLSNGFKFRQGTYDPNKAVNYIYAAFAEMPFKYARSR